MTAKSAAAYQFLPWIRRGISTAIAQQDTLDGSIPGVASVVVGLKLNRSQAIDQNVGLLGPGDVVGIDERQIIRTDPRSNAMDFESNYFPIIEFDEPDFPWLLTPATANSQARLRPWLCLIVVRKQEGVHFSTASGKLGVLEIKAPATPKDELPDLKESWAWAHAQIVTISGDSRIEDVVEKNPERTLSRLLCPRRLEPETQYYACVVPAFALGRKAGLGESIGTADLTALEPSWTLQEESVRLPVYHHWEFATAPAGDFEQLARRLKAQKAPSDIGAKKIDFSDAGIGIESDVRAQEVVIEGALRSPELNYADWNAESREAFKRQLVARFNAQNDDLLLPPLYGSAHTGCQRISGSGQEPAWLIELNCDPRNRIAAALGQAVVQKHQDALVGSAWEQVGEIEKVNQLLRQTQLAQATAERMYQNRFQMMSSETLLAITSPAHGRVQFEKGKSLFGNLHETSLPPTAVSGYLRKSLRGMAKKGVESRKLLSAMGKATLKVASRRKLPSGAITLDALSEAIPKGAGQTGIKLKFREVSADRVTKATPRPDFTLSMQDGGKRVLAPSRPAATTDNTVAAAFRLAAGMHQKRMLSITSPAAIQPPVPFDFDRARVKLSEAMNPKHSFTSRLKARFSTGTDKNSAADNCSEMKTAPVFPQPMCDALAELAPGFLLPGAEKIPANSICTLSVNTRFVEAFMVGLNHELSRELQWRGFPTDASATYFQRFWDAGSEDGAGADIPPIREWAREKQLGKSFTGAGSKGEVVVAIRGDLIRRYPNAIIYLIKAAWSGEKRILGSEELHPLFRAEVGPDILLCGFSLKPSEIAGNRKHHLDPGWFLIVQEQPTELRFGLDIGGSFASRPTSWKDVAWNQLAETEAALNSITHVPVQGNLSGVTIDGIQWGRTAADFASITAQNVMRIAMHGELIVHDATVDTP